jgi:hypothetical protein
MGRLENHPRSNERRYNQRCKRSDRRQTVDEARVPFRGAGRAPRFHKYSHIAKQTGFQTDRGMNG